MKFEKLEIYDSPVRKVTVLILHTTVKQNGSNYASGIYYYKLQAGDFTETRKMLLVK